MMISMEGPDIPDVRSEVGKNAWPEYTEFITCVYDGWIPLHRVHYNCSLVYSFNTDVYASVLLIYVLKILKCCFVN